MDASTDALLKKPYQIPARMCDSVQQHTRHMNSKVKIQSERSRPKD